MIDYDELTVVGIGASAGGFEAFQQLLPKLPQNPTISYIIAQHLSPKQPTLFGELLSKYLPFEIIPVKDGSKIEANRVYYCPPNKDVTIKNGIFTLSEPEVKACPKPSINKLFSSLAIDKKEKAVGIILSGTGSDGAKGIVDISKYGGIALSEDEGAKYYSMPKAAIDTGKVIASLPPELIAEGIEHVIVDRQYFDKYFQLQDSTAKIFGILNQKTSIDFSSYKEATITRRIAKRMSQTKSSGVDAYLQTLQKDDEEVDRLKDELLIIVTSFFRDKKAFLELEKYLESLVKEKLEKSIRIWIPGCATGEEPYSIAMILCEIFTRLNITKQVTIFATDVSEKTIQKVRNRYFTSEQIEGVSQSYIEKYFDIKDELYKPKKILRDMIVFSKHDLVKDAPFLNLDLISCRNLLIYFDVELQKRVLSIFYYSLRYESLLFLGKSETVGKLSSLFAILNNKYKIYKKSNDIAKIDIDTLTYVKKINFIQNPQKKEIEKVSTLDIDFATNQAIGNKYAKNGIIIDGSSCNILFYKGDCKEYIALPDGMQTNEIDRLIVDYLKLDLRATVNKAKKQKIFVESKKIRVMPIREPKEYVTISVFPLEKNKLGEETFFIAFQKEVDNTKLFPLVDAFEPTIADDNEVNTLEDELSSLKERLQIAMEELETSNEELQSTNEELQSTNEELETSNEELQSTNEELQTVNDELGYANLELEFANKAFNNVLETIDAYVMLLDTKLNILKYTDGIAKFFNISQRSDTNFSTVLLNSTINLPNLIEDIKETLLNNKQIGYDIEYNNKNYYFSIKRINISVNHINNFDEGVVLSFVDKTDITKKDKILFQQSKMASMGEMIGNIAHQWRQPLNMLSAMNIKLGMLYDMGKLDSEAIKEFKEKSSKTIQKMSETINDFRNFFRPNKEKIKFNLKDTISDAVKFTHDAYKDNGIAIKNNIKNDVFIMGYKNELIQVLLNLLNNSKDAIKTKTVKNPNVTMNIAIDTENIVIEIIDNGGGIDEKILQKIFEPYFTTKFKDEGTGLGLYMSKMIIEDSIGGEISLENYKDGVRATLILPKENV